MLGLWRHAMRLLPFRMPGRLIGRRRAREESAPEPKRKPPGRKRRRWWLQFSLRGLLVFTLLVAVGLSLWKIYLAPYYRQKPAIDELRRMGIEFHVEPGEGPRWVGWLVGKEDFVRIIRVIDRNHRHHYGGEELERLLNVFDRLPFVDTISFRGDFTDASLVHLKDKDRLTVLCLSHSKIQGPALRHLAAAKHLSYLGLWGAESFGDAGLQQLNSHNELEWLALDGTQVTDDGLASLRNLPCLKRLWLSRTGITDAGLANLADLHELERLDLDGTRITDAGLMHLEGLRKLDHLDLSDTVITGEGLVHLRHIGHGLTLYLERTQMTDSMIEAFKHLPPRTFVYDGGQLSREALRKLQQLRPDVRVIRQPKLPEMPWPKRSYPILILPDPAWPKKMDRVRRLAGILSQPTGWQRSRRFPANKEGRWAVT